MKPPLPLSTSIAQSADVQALFWNISALVFLSGLHLLLWGLVPEVGFWEMMLYLSGGYISNAVMLVQAARRLSQGDNTDHRGQ